MGGKTKKSTEATASVDLKQKEAELTAREEALKVKEAELTSSENALKELDEALTTRSKQLDEIENSLKSKEVELATREEASKAKEAELITREEASKAKEAELITREEALSKGVKIPKTQKLKEALAFEFRGQKYKFVDTAPQNISVGGQAMSQVEISKDEEVLVYLISGKSSLIQKI